MDFPPDLERRAIEALADATVIIDESGNVQVFNRSASEIFGYAPDEVLGRNVSLLMPEPDRSHHDSYIQRYREIGRSRIMSVGRDVVGRTKAGHPIPLWLRISELRVANGVRYFVGSLRDIAERQQLEKHLQAAYEELNRRATDMEMNQASIERSAQQVVELAEELEHQRQILSIAKNNSDYLANHDVLTGLYNRLAFRENFDRIALLTQEMKAFAAVMLIDLDKFKAVNDTMGHDRGDSLLKEVAGILTSNLRDADIVARLGGDEFAIVTRLSSASDLDRLKSIAERFRAALHIPVETPDGIIEVCSTIGVSIYPTDADNIEGLLICADKAMYAGKKLGRDKIVFFGDLKPQSA